MDGEDQRGALSLPIPRAGEGQTSAALFLEHDNTTTPSTATWSAAEALFGIPQHQAYAFASSAAPAGASGGASGGAPAGASGGASGGASAAAAVPSLYIPPAGTDAARALLLSLGSTTRKRPSESAERVKFEGRGRHRNHYQRKREASQIMGTGQPGGDAGEGAGQVGKWGEAEAWATIEAGEGAQGHGDGDGHSKTTPTAAAASAKKTATGSAQRSVRSSRGSKGRGRGPAMDYSVEIDALFASYKTGGADGGRGQSLQGAP